MTQIDEKALIEAKTAGFMAWLDSDSEINANWSDEIISKAIEVYEDAKAKAPAPEVVSDEIAKSLHYPRCWDTVAYPTIYDALREVAACVGCSECKHPGLNPDADQRPASEKLVDALRWYARDINTPGDHLTTSFADYHLKAKQALAEHEKEGSDD